MTRASRPACPIERGALCHRTCASAQMTMRRLLGIEEVRERQVRQVLARVATRVLPSAPDVDVAIRVEDRGCAGRLRSCSDSLGNRRRAQSAVVDEHRVVRNVERRGRALSPPTIDFSLVAPLAARDEKSALKYRCRSPHSVNAGSADQFAGLNRTSSSQGRRSGQRSRRHRYTSTIARSSGPSARARPG